MSFSSDNPLVSNQLPVSIEIPQEPVHLKEYLELWLKRVSASVNTKEGAVYLPQEYATFQNYFGLTSAGAASPSDQLRPVYRMVVDFGALPDTNTTSVAHGIDFTSRFKLTRMYGATTDPSGMVYLPLPYAHPTAANSIALDADATDVNVTTGSDRTAFTWTTIVIEFTKS